MTDRALSLQFSELDLSASGQLSFLAKHQVQGIAERGRVGKRSSDDGEGPVLAARESRVCLG